MRENFFYRNSFKFRFILNKYRIFNLNILKKNYENTYSNYNQEETENIIKLVKNIFLKS